MATVESEDICKYCKCKVDNVFNALECKQLSFAQLVEDSRKCERRENGFNFKLGRLGVIRWLLKNASDFQLQSAYIKTIIEKCAHSCEDDIVDMLELNGVYVKINEEISNIQISTWKKSAIYFALKAGSPEIVCWLLQLKVNAYLSSLSSLLVAAVPTNNLCNIKKLVERGANVNDTATFGSLNVSCFEAACSYGHSNIVKWIFDNNLNDPDPENYSRALEFAFIGQHFHVVEYLVQHGAKLNDSSDLLYFKNILIKAAQFGNIALIKWLIENGAEVSHLKDLLPLAAAQSGHLELLKWFVTQGCDIHHVDDQGHNVLTTAMLAGHLDCVKYLVHKNMDVNVKNNPDDASPMYYAANSDNVDIMKFMIAHGGNIGDIHFQDNRFLLHAAANSLEMIQLLVSLGLNIHYRNTDGESVLNFAAVNHNNNAVEWLLQRGMPVDDLLEESQLWLSQSTEVDSKLELLKLAIKHTSDINMLTNGTTLLHNSITGGSQSIRAVKLLLENNADINAKRTIDNYSVLMCALEKRLGMFDAENLLLKNKNPPKLEEGIFEVVEYLLSQKADVTVQSITGETALYLAVQLHQIDWIKQMIHLEADVNVITASGDTILRQAVQTGKLEIMQLLVEAGADVNQLAYQEISVLNLAAYFNHWNIVKYLIDNGADINHFCHAFKPIIYVALKTQSFTLVQWLSNRGAIDFIVQNQLKVLHECLCFENVNDRLKIIKLFIQNGVNINEVNKNGESLLHECIHDFDTVKYLLENGIDANIINDRGKTALLLCLEKNSFSFLDATRGRIVHKLIKRGANVQIADRKGVTPLHKAVQYPLSAEIVLELLDNGANPHALDNYGNSVLHYIADKESAELLCEREVSLNTLNHERVSALEIALKGIPSYRNGINVVYSLNYRSPSPNVVKSLTSRSLGMKNSLQPSKLKLKEIYHPRYFGLAQFLFHKHTSGALSE